MKIGRNRVVSLVYELRETGPEGKIIEALDESRPMIFIYGSGQLLPHFEINLHSLLKNDIFSFVLKPEDAYGERIEDMIINVPLTVFETEGKIDENICRVGNEVPMMDREGNQINGIINEITDTYVRMDFNHPLAGTQLCFSGRILDVREATGAEIAGLNNSCSSCGSAGDKNSCSGSCR